MIVYRFSPVLFVANLDGEGAKKYGGRWNSKGFPIVYTSLSISLALVELLVHCASINQLQINHLAVIEVPSNLERELIATSLQSNWRQDLKYSRSVGDAFIASNSNLFLQVPSFIIPQENNILINPRHKDFQLIKVKETLSFDFDLCFFK